MDILLIILAFILLLAGIVGSFLPVLPGPPLSWLGMLLIYFCNGKYIESDDLLYAAVFAGGITFLDYYAPIWGTKRFGGTKFGTWGSGIGVIIGIFFGPLGLLAGPFLGALVFELLGGANQTKAFKAAIGSFVGFLIGTFGKLLVAFGILIYCIVALI